MTRYVIDVGDLQQRGTTFITDHLETNPKNLVVGCTYAMIAIQEEKTAFIKTEKKWIN